MTVLNVMEDQQLMENAQNLGTFLANGFRQLQKSYSVIGNLYQCSISKLTNFDQIPNRNNYYKYFNPAAVL